MDGKKTIWQHAKDVLEVVAYLLGCVTFVAGKIDHATFWVLVAVYLAVTNP